MSARGKKPTRSDRDRVVTIMANGIQNRVGWFNGWKVSDEAAREACEAGARDAIDRLRRAGYEIRKVKLADTPLCASCTTPDWCREHPDVMGDCMEIIGPKRKRKRT